METPAKLIGFYNLPPPVHSCQWMHMMWQKQPAVLIARQNGSGETLRPTPLMAPLLRILSFRLRHVYLCAKLARSHRLRKEKRFGYPWSQSTANGRTTISS
jgi:hypothetical protein